MKKVINCIYDLARIVEKQFGTKYKIGDSSRSYSFSEDEMQKAKVKRIHLYPIQRDLEEIEANEKTKGKPENKVFEEITKGYQ